METEDAMVVAGNAVDNLGVPEALKLASGGRNVSHESGPAVCSDVEGQEKTLSKEGDVEASKSEAVGSGVTIQAVYKGGDDDDKYEGGMLVQCSTERSEAILAVGQVPSRDSRKVIEGIVLTDTVTKDTEIEGGQSRAQTGMTGGEEVAGTQKVQASIVADSLMEHVAIESAIDVSPSLVKEGAVASGEIQSLRVHPSAELSKISNVTMNGSMSTSPKLSSEFANVKEGRVLAQKTETTRSREDMIKKYENIMVIQESRKDADRYRNSSSSIAEVVAAEVAAGVAEGIAESIAETIAKETAGMFGQGSIEGRLFDSGRFERMAIVKAVADEIAEGVAQEVAQGLTDGLAEAAATAGAFNGVEQGKLDNIQGMTEGNEDGVLCECGVVAVVRVVGEKSPNRGLRYLMCSRQEPSFFKRKGKRKDSDTIGKCKFFRWLDAPRHTSKEIKKDKKHQEKEKAQLEELNSSYSTRSSAKKSDMESPTGVGTLSSGDGDEVSPSDIPSSRNTDDRLPSPGAPESTPDLKAKPARKQRKKLLVEEPGRDDIQVADRPTTAGTLTRSALRKGAPELVQEPSLPASVVSTPVSALGKRTSDWTDTYVGPESQVFEKGGSWRKRRSVRGENGPTSRYSIGGSGRNTGFGSSEKKPLHYFRRSTGQIGTSDEETINLLSSPNPLTDVESAGAGPKNETDNCFKSYYKKGKVGSSSEQKSKSIAANTKDKSQLGGGKSRVSHAAQEDSPAETEKKTKSQTRRQQRKLPLSEVYGAVEPLLPGKATRKGTITLVDKDQSLSPSKQSLGKSTPLGGAREHKEAGHSKSPPKKRKLSWVLSEDSAMQETDTPRRISARKTNSGSNINFGSQNILSSMVEAPLLASAFPTVRYEAKLPAEDYHDPDDPWSLEIPWAKQEDREEKAQYQERETEAVTDEISGEAEEGEDIRMKMDVRESTDAVNEVAATGEDLLKKLSQGAESVSVLEPSELTRSEDAGGISEPISLDMSPNAAADKYTDISRSHTDQENINGIVDTDTSVADAVDGGENILSACAGESVGLHAGLLVDSQELGDVSKEDPANTEHNACIMADKTVEATSLPAIEEEFPNPSTLIRGNLDSPVHIGGDLADHLKSKSPHQDQQATPEEATPESHVTTPLSREEKFVHPRLCSDTVPPQSARDENMLIQNEVVVVRNSEGSVNPSLDNDTLVSAPDVSEPSEQIVDISQNVQESIVGSLSQEDVNNLETDLPSSQVAGNDPEVLDGHTSQIEGGSDIIIEAPSKVLGNDPEVLDGHTSPNEGGSDICIEAPTLHKQEAAIFRDQQPSVVPDDQHTGDKTQTCMLAAQPSIQVEAGRQEPLMSESVIMEVSDGIDHTTADKTDLTSPLGQLPVNQEIVTNDSKQNIHVQEGTTEDAMREDNLLPESDAHVLEAITEATMREDNILTGSDAHVLEATTEAAMREDNILPGSDAHVREATTEDAMREDNLLPGSDDHVLEVTTEEITREDNLLPESDAHVPEATTEAAMRQDNLLPESDAHVREATIEATMREDNILPGSDAHVREATTEDAMREDNLLPGSDDHVLEVTTEEITREDNLLPESDAHVPEATTEAAMRQDNLLPGSAAVVSMDSLSKLDDTVKTGTSPPCERYEPPGALSDAAATNETELVLSGDRHGPDDFQDNVKRNDGPIEEPAISGSNLIAEGCPDDRVGQVSTHEPERDHAHASLDQDAAFKSPRQADHVGAAAASENAGFVNSVWKLAGKKTRSIGSIGAPAVTSKRSRSVVPSHKGAPIAESKGDPKHHAEIQWVDVPLDWRNEKSTGRVPLLSNSSGSELRLLQSADSSQGTHSARPRLARGEIDESSIITEEKEKGHDSQVTNGAAHARQATLGSAVMGDEASVPADGQYLVGGPTNQQAVVAGGENVVQKRKRGRPRKDSKKPIGIKSAVAGGQKVVATGGVNQTPEPELAGVVGKANGEPSSMIICSTTMEDNTLTELHGEDRVSQLERSASNTERENGKREGGSSGPDECGRPLDGSDFPCATGGGLHSEIVAPYCLCKVVPRQAILRTVDRSADPNQGLRYWSCSNYKKLFTKKRKSSSEVIEGSCNYFRWLDTPKVTAKDKREARKERYRQVEMQRLL